MGDAPVNEGRDGEASGDDSRRSPSIYKVIRICKV